MDENGFEVVAFRAKNQDWLALLNTFRTYEWTYPYQPLDYSFKYMQQILYPKQIVSIKSVLLVYNNLKYE